jgi:hypothetical protein
VEFFHNKEIKMKYWCYNEYDPDSPKADEYGGYVVTLCEDEILKHYYPYWSGEMIKKFGQEEFDKTYCKLDCIDDWVVVNWAWESK